ncbi:MAG TPA: isocitrate lyase/phosphoenolpyruvate mutase family protein [Actinomycetota bacterium]
MLEQRCDLLRSLHRPGKPLVLANAWDVASAKAVVSAGFPVVGTTSGGVAATMGYEDHEGAPADEMLAAAARIARSVDVPVTVDAEAGYGMAPGDLVDALLSAGAAGCNLEDTDHTSGRLVDMGRQGDWLAAVRGAAAARNYGLVINARIDVFLADGGVQPQRDLLDEAVNRARSYVAAGADCVFPIFLSGSETIALFVEAVQAPVNILALAEAPSIARLAELRVARISYGSLIHRRAMEELATFLAHMAR